MDLPLYKNMKKNDLEHRISLFTTLLVIAMFVTVALYVYAGKQQNLPTRSFGAVNTKKTLNVGGQTYQKTEIITLSDGGTLEPVTGVSKIFTIENNAGTSNVFLPSSETLDTINELRGGYTVSFPIANNSASQTVTINVASGDTRMTIVNNNATSIAANTSRSVLIRKKMDDDYQTIVF
jgi:hypothetical protein